MTWRKAPEELVATFNAVVPGPPAEARKMFGYPACFINGNMFMGLFQDKMIVRLPDDERAALAKLGAKPFEPMPGRAIREYVTVPTALLGNRAQLAAWTAKALRYGASLAPKSKTGKRSSAKTRARK
jgi:TfoX/Sxy family transcriptional regulator of competence genes